LIIIRLSNAHGQLRRLEALAHYDENVFA
jgi:hypothetical protein